jgi:hypothetical protein
MKSILDYRGGELVMIVDADELYELIELYEIDEMVALAEVTVETVACQKGKIYKAPRDLIAENRDWDGLVPILLHNGSLVHLPIGAFIDEDDLQDTNERFTSTRRSNLSDSISDNDSDDQDDRDEDREPVIVRHAPSEEFMIRLLAAETIQNAFRYPSQSSIV